MVPGHEAPIRVQANAVGRINVQDGRARMGCRSRAAGHRGGHVNEQAPGEVRAQQLEAAVQGILQQIEGLGQATLYQEPDEGEWSVMKILAHVAELIPYWTRQAQDVATRAENNQPFGRTHEDSDRIAAVEEHAHDSLEDVLPRIRSGLAEATAALRALPPEGWKRTARHARRGEMTVEQIVDQFLLEHIDEHSEQMRAVRDSLTSY